MPGERPNTIAQHTLSLDSTEDGLPGCYGGALSAVRAQCNYLGVWP